MKLASTTLIVALLFATGVQAAEEIKYQNNFEKAETGSIPEDFLVLDGQFAVKEEGGNKFLELPGAPLDTYGVLFGPTLKENSSVTARFFSTAKGRRFPTFAVGLNGDWTGFAFNRHTILNQTGNGDALSGDRRRDGHHRAGVVVDNR